MADTAKLPAILETNEDTRDIVGTDDDITVGWENGTSKQTDSSEVPHADKHNTHQADTPHALYRQPSKGMNSRTADRPSLIKGHSRWNLSAPQLVRESSTTDLATGKEGGKETVCEEVIMAKDAMNPARRLYSKFFSFRTEKEEDIETASPKQYRLTSRRTEEKWNLWQKITGIGPDGEGSDCGKSSGGDYVTMYLRWTLRTSFIWLILSSLFVFWALSFIFAALIYGVGSYQPECLYVNGRNDTDARHVFVDAFALSWTTLSTVGYGVVFPTLPVDDGPRCFGINAFCAIEAFVGVLFVGFSSAIIFGKVSRIQSFATVDFSDPIVVRYGTGVMPAKVDDSPSKHTAAEERLSICKQCPCPVLEFRCINRMHSEGGGEIVNATVNVIAAVLASKASVSVRSVISPKSRSQHLFGAAQKVSTTTGKAGPLMMDAAQKVTTFAGKAGRLVTDTAQKVTTVAGKAVTTAGQATGIFGSTFPENSAAYDPDEPCQSFHLANERNLIPTDMLAASGITREHQGVLDEGSDLVPQRIFFNLEVETPVFPFFKRVWNIGHVLDQSSPLLSRKAKELIAQNDGFWPEELNNYQAVRENLHFHEIIVNLSGTGNATGSSVYAQKVYSFCDVNIGYSFVSTMFCCPNGKVGVDHHLINDVVEQNGGGGEPLTVVKERRLSINNVVHVAKEAYEKTHGTGLR